MVRQKAKRRSRRRPDRPKPALREPLRLTLGRAVVAPLVILVLVIALTVVGLSLLESPARPPKRPAAANGGFDFQLKPGKERRVRLEAFVLFARDRSPLVVLVPHMRVDFGETVPWMVVATGTMRAARLAAPDRTVRVVRRSNATYFYGVARPLTEATITYDGAAHGPEEVAYLGPALRLQVPGPFVRISDGFAVIDLPGFGDSGLSFRGLVGTESGRQGYGDPDLAIELTMTQRLRGYQLTAITPSPGSDDPLKWHGTGYIRVGATGTDPEHADGTERSNVFAGLLLGFALSLLLPFASMCRTAVRSFRSAP